MRFRPAWEWREGGCRKWMGWVVEEGGGEGGGGGGWQERFFATLEASMLFNLLGVVIATILSNSKQII